MPMGVSQAFPETASVQPVDQLSSSGAKRCRDTTRQTTHVRPPILSTSKAAKIPQKRHTRKLVSIKAENGYVFTVPGGPPFKLSGNTTATHTEIVSILRDFVSCVEPAYKERGNDLFKERARRGYILAACRLKERGLALG